MSSGSVSLGNQRLIQYTFVTFQAGDNITGNSAWNVNTGNLATQTSPNQGPIGISDPGLYVIRVTSRAYNSDGRDWAGICSIYRFGGTLYCKPLGVLYGDNVMLYDSNNLRNNTFIDSVSRVISTSGQFLIGMDTNYGGTQEIAFINVYHMCS